MNHFLKSAKYPSLATFLLFMATLQTSFAITDISGSLLLEAKRLEDFSKTTYGQNSNNYVAPTTVEWNSFLQLADTLFTGNITNAETLATNLNYEAIRFNDTNSGILLLGVRSQETNGVPVRGWGTYLVNTNFTTSALVESPHPQFDFKSPILAADVFLKSRARGLLIAGAHRHANGDSTADPCDLTNMIFHAVHVSWSGTNSENTAWQIHGFGLSGHPDFPTNCQAVLSTGQNGTNLMSTNLLILNQEMESHGIKAYAFNRNMASNDLLNIEVNEGIPGTNFTDLGARSNVQGIFSRGLGGTFVHVETLTFLRTNDTWRATTGTAIARAISPPMEPILPFHITALPIDLSSLRLSVPTSPARFYALEQNANLSSTNWQPVTTFTGDGSVRHLTNNISTNSTFYRVRQK